MIKLYWLAVALIIVKSLSDAFIMQSPSAQMWNDDLMRLVQVRNFLAGQGWYDVTQYRLGLEGGTVLHWSRLIDLPIAGLILFFDLFMSSKNAEITAGAVWPLFLLAIAIGLLTRISNAIGEKETGFASLYLGSFVIYMGGKFGVGSLDHHNVQIVFTLACLAAALSSQTGYKAGIIGGLFAALSLVVGLEAIVYIALFCLAAALRWWWHGADRKTATLGFSAGFFVTLIISFLAFWPETSKTDFRCDALDEQLLLLAGFGSAGLFLIVPVLSNQSKMVRLIGLVSLGATTLIFGKLFAPDCLSNPMSQIYPDVRTYWLDRVNEAKPFLVWLQDPANRSSFGQLLLPVIAVAYLIFSIFKSQHKEEKLLLTVLIAISWAISLYQVRASAFTDIFIIPALALLLADSYKWYKSTNNSKIGIVFIVLIVALNSMFWRELISEFTPKNDINASVSLVGANTSDDEQLCLSSQLIEQLNAFEPGLIVSGTNFAPYILMETKHRVLASNFHRNHDGIQALVDFSKSDAAQAKEYLYSWNAKYVVLCTGIGDTWGQSLFAEEDGTIWPLLNAGTPPNYLTQVGEGTGILKIFQVNKPEGS